MQHHYCVAILGWDPGAGGASTQFSLLSSMSSLSGGEVGHLAMAAFIVDVAEGDQNIDDHISNALDRVIQSEDESLMTSSLPIGDSGIQSARYLSFWGNLLSFLGGDGDMMVTAQADREELNNRLPTTVKCSRISEESYRNVIRRMEELTNNPGNWRPTRNCSTLVRESLELAEHVNGGPLLRRTNFCEDLSYACIDTPHAILNRFPDTIMLHYGHANRVAPGRD